MTIDTTVKYARRARCAPNGGDAMVSREPLTTATESDSADPAKPAAVTDDGPDQDAAERYRRLTSGRICWDGWLRTPTW
ncbi:MAG: hypothetical protein JST91_14405 [Actinobacteria bacterium]|nr:hypothetical protein [Actinomycetota bacterium]